MSRLRLKAIPKRNDKRRRESELWPTWMNAAAKLASAFHNDAFEDDPFCYGETASVGFLATAAAKAGYLALPEFAVPKIGAKDRRRRARGRSDLWLQMKTERDWWFEFKQHFISRGSDRDLQRAWENAEKCAKQVTLHGTAVAGLVVSFDFLKRKRPENLEAARDAIQRFCRKRQFAWQIGDAEVGPETWIFLDIVK